MRRMLSCAALTGALLAGPVAPASAAEPAAGEPVVYNVAPRYEAFRERYPTHRGWPSPYRHSDPHRYGDPPHGGWREGYGRPWAYQDRWRPNGYGYGYGGDRGYGTRYHSRPYGYPPWRYEARPAPRGGYRQPYDTGRWVYLPARGL